MRTTSETGGITLVSGPVEATFLPDLGMLGVSLRHRGEELLALPGGLDGYRRGDVTGLPLLAPWANRLGGRRYTVGDTTVDLAGLDLHTDEHGLPIHGTMSARPGWELLAIRPDTLAARYDYGAHPDLLAAFPFPHELRIEARVDGGGLVVDTTLTPTGDRAVPVAFGYHPYLRLPGVDRADVGLRLPPRSHLALDERSLPTGVAHAEAAEDGPIGARTFDDCYELFDDRRLEIRGGGRRLSVVLDDGYPFAQVYVPAGADVVCLEPMTAPGNALLDGGYRLVAPGGSFTARFVVHVEDVPARS